MFSTTTQYQGQCQNFPIRENWRTKLFTLQNPQSLSNWWIQVSWKVGVKRELKTVWDTNHSHTSTCGGEGRLYLKHFYNVNTLMFRPSASLRLYLVFQNSGIQIQMLQSGNWRSLLLEFCSRENI